MHQHGQREVRPLGQFQPQREGPLGRHSAIIVAGHSGTPVSTASPVSAALALERGSTSPRSMHTSPEYSKVTFAPAPAICSAE